jgi:Kelch motif
MDGHGRESSTRRDSEMAILGEPVRCRIAVPITLATAIFVGLSACGTSSPVAPTATARSTAPKALTAPSATSNSNAPTYAPRITIARSAIRLPAARSRGVALALGSGILFCGGLASDGSTSGVIVRIDLETNRASVIGAMPVAVHDAGAAVIDGFGLVFGGGSSAPTSVAQRLNASAAGSIVGELPANRADLAAVEVDGELVIVGGGTPARNDDRVLATSDGRTFRQVARLVVPVRYPAVAVSNGIVYVIGGRTDAGDSNLVQAMNPRTGTTRIVGHLARGLSHASAFVVGDVLLVAGGRTAGVAQDAVWHIDLTRGTATEVGRLPYRVSDMASAVVDGVAYLIGGEQVGPIASIITVLDRTT